MGQDPSCLHFSVRADVVDSLQSRGAQPGSHHSYVWPAPQSEGVQTNTRPWTHVNITQTRPQAHIYGCLDPHTHSVSIQFALIPSQVAKNKTKNITNIHFLFSPLVMPPNVRLNHSNLRCKPLRLPENYPRWKAVFSPQILPSAWVCRTRSRQSADTETRPQAQLPVQAD